MTGTLTPATLFVDQQVAFTSRRNINGLDPLGIERAVSAALSYAFGSAKDAGRVPVQIEVIVRVAP